MESLLIILRLVRQNLNKPGRCDPAAAAGARAAATATEAAENLRTQLSSLKLIAAGPGLTGVTSGKFNSINS